MILNYLYRIILKELALSVKGKDLDRGPEAVVRMLKDLNQPRRKPTPVLFLFVINYCKISNFPIAMGRHIGMLSRCAAHQTAPPARATHHQHLPSFVWLEIYKKHSSYCKA